MTGPLTGNACTGDSIYMCAYNLEKALKHIGIQVFGTGECVRDWVSLPCLLFLVMDSLAIWQ